MTAAALPAWGRPIALLDRDGVINRRLAAGVRRVSELEILPRALEAIARLSQAGALVAVVSNQANIGRGLLSEQSLAAIHARLLGEIARAGGHLDGVYYCPHTPDDCCLCRKPEPGLLIRAAWDLRFDPVAAWMIGDSDSDVEAARRAGCRAVLVGTSAGEPRPSEGAPDFVARDLFEAVETILATLRPVGDDVHGFDSVGSTNRWPGVREAVG